MLNLLALVITTLIPQMARTSPVPGTPSEQATITHLPEAVQSDIQAWRSRLAQATCLKVVCDTTETWTSLYEFDASGTPKTLLSERWSAHSWMTPDAVWTVIFPYKDDAVDFTHPVLQQYWTATTGEAWERTWNAHAASYKVRKFKCEEEGGPASPDFGAQGCIYASVLQSWLAGQADFYKRPAVQSIALLRRPNLPMVPPDPAAPGLWLDVFWDKVDRDQEPDPTSVYRRHDFMRLSRDRQGLPEVSEWRTIVVNDPSDAGRKPQQITGIRRFSYAFHDREPVELRTAIQAFVADIDLALDRSP